jgi:hypothetical protein
LLIFEVTEGRIPLPNQKSKINNRKSPIHGDVPPKDKSCGGSSTKPTATSGSIIERLRKRRRKLLRFIKHREQDPNPIVLPGLKRLFDFSRLGWHSSKIEMETRKRRDHRDSAHVGDRNLSDLALLIASLKGR